MSVLTKGRNVFGWPLDQDSKEVGRARELVRKALSDYELDDELRGDVELVVSELVTNAVVHGAAQIELAVHVLYDRIRVCVTDASPQPLIPGQPASHDERGRGLAIVQSYGRLWVCARHPGKEVWAEFLRPSTELPLSLMACIPGHSTSTGCGVPCSGFSAFMFSPPH
ncbi:ATP-binding protein [Nonomuraea typhae]|uniref:ATP-binding protein n=1 Tax=Nonomuraea typhae TaxID=2603600 RepID=A0ABW7ZEC4_9ACTN